MDLKWKTGILLHQTVIKGGGGTAVLNNGSSTSTFYLPDSSTTNNQFLFELGLSYPFGKYILESSFLIESILNNKTRNFYFLLGLSYQIGSL